MKNFKNLIYLKSSKRLIFEFICFNVFFVLACCSAYYAIGYGLTKEGMSGPGLYPAIISILCAFFAITESVFLVFKFFSQKNNPESSEIPDEIPDYFILDILWLKLGYYVLGLTFIIIFFNYLGFYLSTGLGLLLILFLAEKKSFALSLLVSVIMVVSCFVIFSVLLGIVFPLPLFY